MESIQKTSGQGCRCDKSLLYEDDNDISGMNVADAFKHFSPVIDTDQTVGFLRKLVKNKGARLLNETIQGDLMEHKDELLGKNHVDAIVGVSGLGARKPASDLNVRPAHGGLLRIRPL